MTKLSLFIIFLSCLFYGNKGGAEVVPYVCSTCNMTPVKWTYDAMYENHVSGRLVSIQTQSSGYYDSKHKKGRRDTIILLPFVDRQVQKMPIIYWFHGLTGFKKRTFAKRLVPQYAWLSHKKKVKAVLVITEMPWSWFTRTRWNRQSRVFRKMDEFYFYTQEVEMSIMKHLPSDVILERIVIGHSAGGSAIASAAKHGGLCKTRPAAVVFSDATYGNWFERSWQGCLNSYSKSDNVRILVLGQSFGSPWKKYARWQKKNRKRSRFVEAHVLPLPWTHGKIGDNAIPFLYGVFVNNKYSNVLLHNKQGY